MAAGCRADREAVLPEGLPVEEWASPAGIAHRRTPCKVDVSRRELPTTEARQPSRASRFLPGKVETVPVRLLLDTGSNVNILSLTTFNKLPLDVRIRRQACGTHGLQADGTELPFFGTVSLNVTLGETTSEVTMMISQISEDAILGMPFFTDNHCVMDFERRRLRVGDLWLACDDEADEAGGTVKRVGAGRVKDIELGERQKLAASCSEKTTHDVSREAVKQCCRERVAMRMDSRTPPSVVSSSELKAGVNDKHEPAASCPEETTANNSQEAVSERCEVEEKQADIDSWSTHYALQSRLASEKQASMQATKREPFVDKETASFRSHLTPETRSLGGDFRNAEASANRIVLASSPDGRWRERTSSASALGDSPLERGSWGYEERAPPKPPDPAGVRKKARVYRVSTRAPAGCQEEARWSGDPSGSSLTNRTTSGGAKSAHVRMLSRNFRQYIRKRGARGRPFTFGDDSDSMCDWSAEPLETTDKDWEEWSRELDDVCTSPKVSHEQGLPPAATPVRTSLSPVAETAVATTSAGEGNLARQDLRRVLRRRKRQPQETDPCEEEEDIGQGSTPVRMVTGQASPATVTAATFQLRVSDSTREQIEETADRSNWSCRLCGHRSGPKRLLMHVRSHFLTLFCTCGYQSGSRDAIYVHQKGDGHTGSRAVYGVDRASYAALCEELEWENPAPFKEHPPVTRIRIKIPKKRGKAGATGPRAKQPRPASPAGSTTPEERPCRVKSEVRAVKATSSGAREEATRKEMPEPAPELGYYQLSDGFPGNRRKMRRWAQEEVDQLRGHLCDLERLDQPSHFAHLRRREAKRIREEMKRYRDVIRAMTD